MLRPSRRFSLCTPAFAAALGLLLAAAPVRAVDCSTVPPINGQNLPSAYSGGVNAAQDNPTRFGDHAPPLQADSQGSELDRLYMAHDASAIYIGVVGNTPRTDTLGNSIILLIDVSDVTASTALDTANLVGGAGALQHVSGVRLEGDFKPEWAVQYWNDLGTSGGAHHALLFDLTNTNSTGTALTLNTDFAIDNSNLIGVNDNASNDPTTQESNAATAKSGFQFKLTKAALGITHANIRVQAILANQAGAISNQSLPPLRPTSGQTGGGIACIGNFDVNSNYVTMAGYSGDQYATFDLNTNVNAHHAVALGASDLGAAFGASALLATQNNYTCFGDAAVYQPGLTAGSELDLLYVRNDTHNLYVGIAGQIPVNEGTNNTIILFIETPSSGACNRLFTASLTGGSGAVQNLDLFQFDGTVVGTSQCSQVGFHPDFAVQYWRTGSSDNAIIKDLVYDVTTPLNFSIDPAFHVNAGNAYVANVRNVAGINDIPGDDPLRQTANARTAQKGVQFSLSLTTLGLTPFSNVRMMACIVSGSGYVSNQFLPPLKPTTPPALTSTDLFTPNQVVTDNGSITDSHLLAPNALTRVTGVSVTVNILHPAVEQLTLDLRHDATGRTVRLWNANTHTGANMSTTFAQGGAPLSGWTAPGTGTFQPVGSMLDFNDVDPNSGTWSLVVADTVSGQTGTLNSWTLTLTEDVGGDVGCLGSQFDNHIDLNTYPGNQYLPLTLNPSSGAPIPSGGLFTGANIPATFGDASTNAAGAIAVQNNYSCFGNAFDNSLAPNAGSEMDQLFVSNSADRLKVAVTGNLEGNGNAFIVLLDTVPAAGVPIDPGTGNAKIQGITQPPPALGGYNAAAPGLNGLILDPGFRPDYAVTVQRDTTKPTDYFEVYVTNLVTNSSRKVGSALRNSGSGELAPPTPNGNGSEVDMLYVANDAGNLYLGVTGNLENNGNSYIVFIQTPASALTNVLATNFLPFMAALKNVNGDILDAGFAPNYAIVMNRAAGAYTAQLANLANGTVVPLALVADGAAGHFFGDNLNSVGVTGASLGAGEAAQQTVNAQTASRGVQFSLARSSLGNPADGQSLNLAVAVLSSGGYWSNQVLPGLGGNINNLGDSANLSDANTSLPVGNQFAPYALSGTPYTPSSFNGSDIPAAFGDASTNHAGALAIQNNYTQFGDQGLPPGSGNPNCLQVAFDDTNILGVTASSPAGAASAVTGMEFDLPFVDIGLAPLNPQGVQPTVKVMAVLTGDSGYLSNQCLPGFGRQIRDGQGQPTNVGFVPAAGLNLGDNNTNTGFPGDQFLSWTLVVPRAPADINADGLVNAQDVLDFVRVLLGLNVNPVHVANSDFNNSGTADGRDAQFFVNAYIP